MRRSLAVAAALLLATTGSAGTLPLPPLLEFTESGSADDQASFSQGLRLRARIPLLPGEDPASAGIRVGGLDLSIPLVGGRGRTAVVETFRRIRARAEVRQGSLVLRAHGAFFSGEGLLPRTAYLGRTGPVSGLLEAEVSAGERSVPFAVGFCGWNRVINPGIGNQRVRARGAGVAAGTPGPRLYLVRPPSTRRWAGRAAGMAIAAGEAPEVSFSLDGGPPAPPDPVRTAEVTLGGTRFVQAVFDAAVPSPEGPHVLEVRARAGGVEGRESLPFEAPAIVPPLAIDLGFIHQLEIREGGDVWAWGFSYDGALGVDVPEWASLPIPVEGPRDARSVAAGDCFSLAVDGEGATWVWGRMPYAGPAPGGRPTVMGGVPPARQVASGNSHAVALLRNGSVVAWGFNLWGAVGDGTRDDRGRPVPVKGLYDVLSIAAGSGTSFAIREDGSLWWWGEYPGFLAEEGLVASPMPGLPPCREVSAGSLHAIALGEDGSVWTWGRNDHGILGDGTTTGRAAPARVEGIPPMKAVAAGSTCSLALDLEGRLWGWGSNDVGELGDGIPGDRLRPALLPSLGRIVAIASESYVSAAVAEDGTVWNWGWTTYDRWGLPGDDDEYASLPVLMRRGEPSGPLAPPAGPAEFGAPVR